MELIGLGSCCIKAPATFFNSLVSRRTDEEQPFRTRPMKKHSSSCFYHISLTVRVYSLFESSISSICHKRTITIDSQTSKPHNKAQHPMFSCSIFMLKSKSEEQHNDSVYHDERSRSWSKILYQETGREKNMPFSLLIVICPHRQRLSIIQLILQ